MNEIQIIETPIGTGSIDQVIKAASAEFPGFAIAKVDQIDGQWQLRLERVAEFPLKPMAPDDDGDPEADAAGGDDHDADDEKPKKKKAPKDDSAEDGIPEPDADDLPEDKPAFGGGEHEHKETVDPITRVEQLLRDLQKVVPQLQNLLKGDSLEKDLPAAAPRLDADPGPHFETPHAPPGAHPPLLPGTPGGSPPAGLGGPPPGPGGIGGPRRQQLPTFTKRKALRLNREANVAEKVARDELTQAYPDYDVEINLEGDQYVATLTLKS